MNRSLLHIILLFPLAVLPWGCNQAGMSLHPADFGGPVPDSCQAEPGHHYLVMKPGKIPSGRKLPVILLIDPHGDGRLAAGKFAEALTDIPVIIAGSEKIRNNDPDFQSSLSHLVEDVLAKYPADPDQVIIAGFSGGARMAYYYGMNHKVLGIIMFGAGPGRSPGETAGKRMFLVSGTRDFNFMEQYLPPFEEFYDVQWYMVDFFRGGHEWPPQDCIYEAVAYLLKDDGDFPENIPGRMVDEKLAECDSLTEANDLFLAGKALEKALIFSPDRKQRARISRQIDDFRNSAAWVSTRRKIEGYLQNESKLKQFYMGKLSDPDTSWWKKEIPDLNQEMLSCQDPEKEDLLYRLKGFIGIALYSRINTLIQSGQRTAELEKLLYIYALAEPDSPDLVRFRERIRHL